MNTRKKGFSFIEVVLVLGIAGLIFIMAFIALPSLWTSQRDAARRANLMEFLSDLKTYQTNNSRGALPTQQSGDTYEVHKWSDIRNGTYTNDWAGFIKDYVDINFEDPSGTKYTFYITRCKTDSGEQATGKPCEYGPTDNSKTNEEGKDILGLNRANLNLENPLDYTIYIAIGATCEGNQMVKASNNRSVAALQILERAGRYCYNT